MPSLAEIVLEGGRLRSDALRRQAEIEAQRQAATGAIWGRTIASVADTAANAITDQQKLKQEAPLVAARTAAQNAQTELLQSQVKKAKDDERAKTLASTMYQQAQANGQQLDPDELVAAYEREGLVDQADHVRTLTQQRRIQAADEMTKHLANTQTAIKLATGLFSNVTDQDHFTAAQSQLSKIVPQEIADYINQQLGPTFDAAKIESLRDMGRSESERLTAQAQALTSARDAIANAKSQAELDDKLTQSGAQLLSTARDAQDYQHLLGVVAGGSKAVAQKFDQDYSPAAIDRAKQLAGGGAKPVYRVSQDGTMQLVGTVPKDSQVLQAPRPPASQAAQSGPVALDADAVELLGAQWRLLGNQAIPTRFDENDKKRIINAGNKQRTALGQSPAAVIQGQLATKADQSSLTLLGKLQSTSDAAEQKALAQTGLIDQLNNKVDRNSFKALNSLIIAGKQQAGNSDAEKLVNALVTFGSEYAKIIEGSTGSVSGSSDTARKASERLASASMSPKVLHDVVEQMKWEMRQTMLGYEAAKNHINDALAGRVGGGSNAPMSAEDLIKKYSGKGGD